MFHSSFFTLNFQQHRFLFLQTFSNTDPSLFKLSATMTPLSSNLQQHRSLFLQTFSNTNPSLFKLSATSTSISSNFQQHRSLFIQTLSNTDSPLRSSAQFLFGCHDLSDFCVFLFNPLGSLFTFKTVGLSLSKRKSILVTHTDENNPMMLVKV